MRETATLEDCQTDGLHGQCLVKAKRLLDIEIQITDDITKSASRRAE